MAVKEFLVLGCRVTAALGRAEEADIRLSWAPAKGTVPLMLAKKRIAAGTAEGFSVRTAETADMAKIRGMYDMTAGRGVMLPVRSGLWTAEGAAVVQDVSGTVCAYAVGSVSGGVYHVHEWGCIPETDAHAALSAAAVQAGCRFYEIRAEFAPADGTVSGGECLYISVDKPFLLGDRRIESAKEFVETVEDTLYGAVTLDLDLE